MRLRLSLGYLFDWLLLSCYRISAIVALLPSNWLGFSSSFSAIFWSKALKFSIAFLKRVIASSMLLVFEHRDAYRNWLFAYSMEPSPCRILLQCMASLL